MAVTRKKLQKGIRLKESSEVTTLDGEIRNDGTNLQAHLDGSERTLVTADQAQTLENKTLTNPEINGNVTGDVIDTDETLAADSDTKIASQKAVKAYVDSSVAGKDEASEITYDPALNPETSATNVQDALDDTGIASQAAQGDATQALTDASAAQTDIDNHIADVADAHSASAITNVPSGNLVATDVQAALNEIQTELDGKAASSEITDHINNPTGAHAASAISNTPSGNLAATDVQAALDELQTDVDTRATDSDLTTHTGATSGVHGVTGDVVGTTDAQDLSNKAIIDPTRLDPKKDTLPNLITYATAAQNGELVYATDVKKSFQVVDGGLRELGSGQGGINYLSGDNSSFDGSIGDWTSSSANLTLSHDTSDQLRGDGSLLVSKGLVDAQDDYVSVPFTIDKADLAKKLVVSFDYETGRAALNDSYDDGDFTVRIFDVDKSQIIRGNGEDIQAGSNTHYMQFQTDATSLNYELRIVCTTNESATPFVVAFDNVRVGPSPIYTAPEIGNVGELVATAWDADITGPYLYANGDAVSRSQFPELFSAIGTTYGVGDGSTTFNLPDLRGEFLRGWDDGRGVDSGRGIGTSQADATAVNGLSVNLAGQHNHETDRVDNPSLNNTFGSSGISRSGIVGGNVGTNQTRLTSTAGNHSHSLSGDSETRPRNVAVKYFIRYRTDRVISVDLGGREVHCVAFLNSAANHTTNGGTEVVPLDTVDEDTTNSFNTSTSTYVIPETGIYHLDSLIAFTSLTDTKFGVAQLRVDGNILVEGTSWRSGGLGGVRSKASITKKLQKGQEVTLRAFQDDSTSEAYMTGLDETYLSITKLASPQTILETETVAARYSSNSGQSIPNATFTTILYEDLTGDTHNAYNPFMGVYTVHVAGWYNIKAQSRLSIAEATGMRINVNNGTIYGQSVNSDTTTSQTCLVSDMIPLNKGDTVEIQVSQSSGGSVNLNTGSAFNYFTIARIK